MAKRAAKKGMGKKGAKKVAKKGAKKGGRKKAAKKAAKKGGRKKAAKKGAKKAGAKKAGKKAVKKGGRAKGAKRRGAAKKASAAPAATPAPEPSAGGSAGKSPTGSSVGARTSKSGGKSFKKKSGTRKKEPDVGLTGPTAAQQPVAVGGTAESKQAAHAVRKEEARTSPGKRTTPSVPAAPAAPAAAAPPRPSETAEPQQQAQAPPAPGDSDESSPGHRGKPPSRRSPMGKRPVEVLFDSPPPVPTPALPEEPVRRQRPSGKGPKVPVTEVNREFYAALESRDIGAIARLWVNDGSARCTQPNGVLQRGWEEVRRGFEQIFASDRPHKIEVTQVYAEESDTIAYVSLVERVAMPQASRPRREHSTTNLFRNVEGHWLMVIHHST